MSATVRKYGSYFNCAISASSCFQRGAVCAEHAVREAPLNALLHQHTQPAGGRVAGGHDLLGVFVTQLVQREGALARDAQRGRQRVGGVQRGQPLARAQVRLGIGLQRQAAFGHRLLQTRGAEHVLQRLARARMHQHRAGRHQHQAGLARHALQPVGVFGVVSVVQQFQGNEGTLHAEPGLQPHGVREHGLEGLRGAGQQQRDAARQPGQIRRMRHAPFHVRRVRQVAALGGAAPRHRDPLRQVAVAAARHRQQHQPRPRQRIGPALDRRVRELQLGADDQVQPRALGLGVRTHHAGQRTFVGDGQRTVAQRVRTLHQFFRKRRAAEEAEVAAAVQLGIGGEHGRSGMSGGRRNEAAQAGNSASSGLRTAPPPTLSTWV